MAATRTFAQHGFRGSTTRRIAEAAGVNEITIFRYFGSKEALLQEAVREISSTPEIGRLTATPRDPHRELTLWAESFIHHLRTRRSIIRTSMGEMEEHPEMTSCMSRVPLDASEQLCAYLLALGEAGLVSEKFDPKAAAAMLMGALFSDAMGRDMMPDAFPHPAENAAAAYVTLLLKALGDIARTPTVHSELSERDTK